MNLIGASATVVLMCIHVFSRRLEFLDQVPRSRILSFSGGVAVTLVFLEILPQLAEHQETVRRTLGGALSFLKHHVYIVALLGLATFYGVDRAVKASRQDRRNAGLEDVPGAGVFWLSITVFGIKNGIVGYLLGSEEWALRHLLLFLSAIGLEFVLSDRALHQEHQRSYDEQGRWVLALAILLGYGIGLWLRVPPIGFAMLSAFLAGAIILTTLKEELPDERQSRFLAFVTGIITYAILVLAR